MKKILYILLLIFGCYQISAQTIVDIAGEHKSKYYKGGNYYLKDIQNLFQPYIGTWQYINGNNEFRITLTKVTMYHEIDTDYNMDFYTDGVIVNYQKFENGLLTYQSPPETYPDGAVSEFGKLYITFTDYQRIYKNTVLNVSRNAGHEGHLTLIPTTNGNYNLHFKLYTERTGTGLEYEPVQSGNPYHSTPTDIIMTKI